MIGRARDERLVDVRAGVRVDTAARRGRARIEVGGTNFSVLVVWFKGIF